MGENLDIRKAISFVIISAFLANTLGPIPVAQAQSAGDFRLPAPGAMVHLSPPLEPPILKGIKVHPDNPFRFDFILDKGDDLRHPERLPRQRRGSEGYQQEQLKQQATKLIKYFLASLTIPEKDLWVNLSPYEKDRIIPQSFGQTEMGRDLLAEDYMLKQITASLIYPEDKIGKKFWKRIYEEAAKKFGKTDIPVNTFNKVWIVPEKAVVYENAKAGTAYVVESKLKVMLEQDYLSMSKHADVGVAEGGQRRGGLYVRPMDGPTQGRPLQETRGQDLDINKLGSDIVREVVIPELTKEVNEDKNFAQLRQVYNSLILATWYKKKIKDSILAQVYADKKKIAGVGYNDSPPLEGGARGGGTNDVELIYQRYLQAFKKGVYNYIKEDQDPLTQQIIPRKYFSGGMDLAMNATHLGATELRTVDAMDSAQLNQKNLEIVSSQLDAQIPVEKNGSSSRLAGHRDRAMINKEDFGEDEQMWQYYQTHRYFPTVPVFLSHVVRNVGKSNSYSLGDVVQIDQLPFNMVFPEENMKKKGLVGKLRLLYILGRGLQLCWIPGERSKWAIETKQKVDQWLSIPAGNFYDWVSFDKEVKVQVHDTSYNIRVEDGKVKLDLQVKKRGEIIYEESKSYQLGKAHETNRKFMFRVDQISDGQYRMHFGSPDYGAILEWTAVPDPSSILGIFKAQVPGKFKNTFGNVDRLQGLSRLVSGNGPIRGVDNIIGGYLNSELSRWQKAKASPTREKVEAFLRKAIQRGEGFIKAYKIAYPKASPAAVNINLAGVWQDPQGHQFVTVVYNKSTNRIYVLKKSGELIAYDKSTEVSGNIESMHIPVVEGDFVIMTSGMPELKNDISFEDDTPGGIADVILHENRNSEGLEYQGVIVVQPLTDSQTEDRAQLAPPQFNATELKDMLKSVASYLKNQLKEMGYGDFEIDENIHMNTTDLPYSDADSVNVGSFMSAVQGIELAPYWAYKKAQKGGDPHVNFLLLQPFQALGFGRSNSNILYTTSAVYINKFGKIAMAIFDRPVRIDAFVHESYTVTRGLQQLEAQGIPVLNTSGMIEVAKHKNTLNHILSSYGIDVPQELVVTPNEMDPVLLLNDVSEFIASQAPAEIVVKPAVGAQGDGVRIFTQEQKQEIIDYVMELSKTDVALVQNRIESEEWRGPQDHQLLDWNLRVITTWDKEGRVYTNPDMIEVRFQPRDRNPVNKSKSAGVVTLREFFKVRRWGPEKQAEFLDEIQRVVSKAAGVLENQSARKQGRSQGTGIVGWDLIRGQDGKFYILEANAGPGGIGTIEKRLARADKGKAILPIMGYLENVAVTHFRNHQSVSMDDQIGERLDVPYGSQVSQAAALEVDPAIGEKILRFETSQGIDSFFNLANVLMRNKKYDGAGGAEETMREGIKRFPNYNNYWNLAYVLCSLQRYVAARIVLREAISHGFIGSGIYALLICALVARGSNAQAGEVLNTESRMHNISQEEIRIKLEAYRSYSPGLDQWLKSLDSAMKGRKTDSARLARQSVDEAMKTKTGGIDLTPANMNLQTKIDSSPAAQNDRGIVFHLDPAMLQQLQDASGFVPMIINIQPMTDLRQFLGIAPPLDGAPPKAVASLRSQ